MVNPGTLPPALDGREVVTLPWERFLAYMRATWQPGEHLAIVGPTGEGKTTVAVGVLQDRKYVVALDAKGGDSTLAAAGYSRIEKLPPFGPLDYQHWKRWQQVWKDVAEGRDVRLVVGFRARSRAEIARLRKLMFDIIDIIRRSGNWTVFADEFQRLTDPRLMRLIVDMVDMLIEARDDGTSIVAAYQAPAWVDKTPSRQARRMIVHSTGDRDMIKNMARSMGRDWHVLTEAIDELPRFYCLMIPRGKHGGPMVLTTAPKVG